MMVLGMDATVNGQAHGLDSYRVVSWLIPDVLDPSVPSDQHLASALVAPNGTWQHYVLPSALRRVPAYFVPSGKRVLP
jgi:hypothetical protein